MLCEEFTYDDCIVRVEVVPAVELRDANSWLPKITATRNGSELRLDAPVPVHATLLTDKEALREGVDRGRLLIQRYLERERKTKEDTR